MWQVARAEFHQLRWAQVTTVAVAAALFALISVVASTSPTHAHDAGVILNYVITLLICSSPVLHGWVADWKQSPSPRFRLLESLPVARWRLNLGRLLGAVASLWTAVLTWIPLWLLLRSIYGNVSMWLGAWVVLAVIYTLLLTMVWRAMLIATLLFLTLAFVLLYLLPDLQLLVSLPLQLVVWPWASAILAAHIIVLALWILRSAASGCRWSIRRSST